MRMLERLGELVDKLHEAEGWIGVPCRPVEQALLMAETLYAEEVERIGSTKSSGSPHGHVHPGLAGTRSEPGRRTDAGTSTEPEGKGSDSSG